MTMLMMIFAGVVLGGLLGHFGKCSGGTCPLTATWRRGALYGGTIGLIAGISCTRTGADLQTRNIQPVAENEFQARVLDSKLPVVVDFYATWCGPCKVLSPMLDQAAATRTNDIAFFKVDVDKAPGLARRYKVEAIPTLVLFREGKVVNTIVGLVPKESLESHLDSLTAKATD
jgi:thioredoxin 1